MSSNNTKIEANIKQRMFSLLNVIRDISPNINSEQYYNLMKAYVLLRTELTVNGVIEK